MGIYDFLNNYKDLSSLTKQLNDNPALHSSVNDAIIQIYNSTKGLKGLLGEPSPSNPAYSMIRELEESIKSSPIAKVTDIHTAAIGTALSAGFKFDSGVQKLLGAAYEPLIRQKELAEISKTASLLGPAFIDRVKPSVYFRDSSEVFLGASAAVSGIQNSLQNAKKPGFRGTAEIVRQASAVRLTTKSLFDTSWLKKDSPWITAITSLSATNTEALLGNRSPFAELVRMEKETSDLFQSYGINKQLTSVSAQVASISDSWKDRLGLWKAEGVLPPSSGIVEDYLRFATTQLKAIQKDVKNDNHSDVEWRLGVLDTTSKFVDRQVTWEKSVEIEEIDDELTSKENDESREEKYRNVEDNSGELINTRHESPFDFSIIPQSIAYSNRQGCNVSTDDAFEGTNFLELTELAKRIIDGVFGINDYRKDIRKELVFSHTHKDTKSLAYLGVLLVDSESKFEELIDNLYFLFYENIEHIKEVVGDGDGKNKGNSIIQNEELYQVIFRIKDIRTDLHHDYEHGNKNKIEKKRKDIEEAYMHYGIRPRRPKEYKSFQKKLYKELSLLVNTIFAKMQKDRDLIE